MKNTLFLLFLIIIMKATSSNTLGPNLLINHDFSTPNILPYGILYSLFSTHILGWNCSNNCEIVDCKVFNWWAAAWHYSNGFSGDCPSQAIDTSSNIIGVISQIFQAQAGHHSLQIKFLVPIDYPSLKTLVIMINEEIVFKYHPSFADFSHKEASMKVMLKEGSNKLSLTAQGYNDTSGFRVFDIKIRRIISPQIDTIIDTASGNALLSNLVAIPCSRILFGQLINTMISFDRMQLYYYHHRRNSYYYNIFIKGIFDLLNQKGIYATYISDTFFSAIGTSEESILKLIDYKEGRKYSDGYDKNNFIQNGGFFFIVSYIPIALIIFFIFNILFRLTFRNKLSKILRKYSFFSLIVLMLFEGNIEQFSFLIMDEFLEYFSVCFGHMILNTVILVIFYFIVFCSTALYLYCWYIHNRKMSYLTDNVSLKMSGMMAYTFDRGMACLVLGSVHRLSLLFGKDQLLILAAVQFLLISPKLIFLQSTSYKLKKFVWLNCTEAFIRIIFILSIYFYEDSGNVSGMINEQIHLKIIYCILFIWTLNLLFAVINSVSQFFHINSSQIEKKRQVLQKAKIIFTSTDIPPAMFLLTKKTFFMTNLICQRSSST